MTDSEVRDVVHSYYWIDDLNCATTTLKTLSKAFSIEISSQVIDAAVGMHGAGKYGAQCGLVEGTLLFIGIYGRFINLEDKETIEICYSFAEGFEKNFYSLLCSKIRPGGFNKNDPEHLCEDVTVRAIIWIINFIKNEMAK
ncbi:MAG: C-GCAxxG-C-C family protein [Spirochaetales bacterium]|nr:C-GCAxxG-C-C family protein [Spirochaetales bacterium]